MRQEKERKGRKKITSMRKEKITKGKKKMEKAKQLMKGTDK